MEPITNTHGQVLKRASFERSDFGGSIHLAIASGEGIESRRSRIYGGRDWVRLGAVELGLDCLRRYLQGLPVTERTDFERV
jgi:nicotinamide-nucleotide amidase